MALDSPPSQAIVQKLTQNEVPPAHLIYRVTGTTDAYAFTDSGKESLFDLELSLAEIGYKFSDFNKILDWGCGCGRIIRHMSEIQANSEIYGCDIDAEAINWAKTHIPYANFSTCDGLPPTLYPDNYFDFIYSHSVMTHLDENYQNLWLVELKRILKPNGILLLSVHGDSIIRNWINDIKTKENNPQPYIDALDKQGTCFYTNDQWGGIFPDYYHSSFHHAWYIFEHWGKLFRIKAYLEQRGLRWQDYVIMMKE